jgi:hypothetical protein
MLAGLFPWLLPSNT